MNMFLRSLSSGMLSYVSGAFIYGAGILFFRTLPYYQRYLLPQTQDTLLYLYLSYLLLSLPCFLFFTKNLSENKPFQLLCGMGRFLSTGKMENKEKNAALFLLVKLFFLPTMINFTYNNLNNLSGLWEDFSIYPFLLTSFFLIDTLIFSLGYTFEFRFLKNTIRSVEPTLLGWTAALICYPPFNSLIGNYVPWGANDYALFWTPTWTLAFRTIVIFLLIIYVWSTLALGLKSSNLTNRGIVTKFPYSLVRHPAYVSKISIWWLTLLPVLNWQLGLGMLFWTFIYYLRAQTEENHLGKDPEYLEYCKKVKWKFLPGLA